MTFLPPYLYSFISIQQRVPLLASSLDTAQLADSPRSVLEVVYSGQESCISGGGSTAHLFVDTVRIQFPHGERPMPRGFILALSNRPLARSYVFQPFCFALFYLPSSSNSLPALLSSSSSVFSHALRLQPWLPSLLSSIFTVFRVQRIFFHAILRHLLMLSSHPSVPTTPGSGGHAPPNKS
ncbi:hypothetical protein FB451DRAFT_1407715 [Mycena latifolia]|nr:hypothetical protein FB451DRAFT_1407715 [Mycena latifolia]